MVTLYGPDGQAIRKPELTREISAPTVSGVRQTLQSHPSIGITPRRLAMVLRAAEHGDPLAYAELAEDMEEKDLHYLGVLGTRKRGVSQLDITVEAAEDDAQSVAAADLVREAIKRDSLEDELFDILDAIGKGWSVSEIVWEESERQWMPARIEYRLPGWFTFDREDPTRLMLRETEGPVPLPPFKFIQHYAKAKSGLPVRGGLARPVAWFWLFKNLTLKDWIVFAEVYGQPLRVGKYPANASEDEKTTLLRAVTQIGTDAAAIIPEGMIIEFVKAEGGRNSGGDVYDKLCAYLDQQVSKAVLGQVATTDAIAGGHAVGRVHRQVQEDIERADAKQLAATLNRDLVRPVVDLNMGPQKVYPTIRIGRADEIDMKEMAAVLKDLVPLGLKVGMSTVRDRIGFGDPGPDEELLGAANTPETETSVSSAGCPIHGLSAHAAGAAETTDSIEDLVADVLASAGWHEIMEPLVAPMRQTLDDSPDLETFRARLSDLVLKLDDGRAAELLARSGFAARLAGETEAETGDAGED